jgi:aerobic-type carbon monoxide dehydrogenase small subunit (CoxS/CutS family)
MSTISLKVNGRSHGVDADPATPLVYVLSDDLGLRGPKLGCGLAQCGSCTVLVGGRAIRSCVTPISRT